MLDFHFSTYNKIQSERPKILTKKYIVQCLISSHASHTLVKIGTYIQIQSSSGFDLCTFCFHMGKKEWAIKSAALWQHCRLCSWMFSMILLLSDKRRVTDDCSEEIPRNLMLWSLDFKFAVLFVVAAAGHMLLMSKLWQLILFCQHDQQTGVWAASLFSSTSDWILILPSSVLLFLAGTSMNHFKGLQFH